MNYDYGKWVGKIVLGTVQFGLDYGISNKTGQIDAVEVAEILNYAFNKGIDTLDTAAAYKTSESIIGSIIDEKHYRFDIVSKLPSKVTSEQFDYVLNNSLQKLKSKSIKSYLTHGFDAFKKKSLRRCLYNAKDKGLVQQVGVSVYYPKEVIWLLEEKVDFDIIQLPFNVFDQRFRTLFDELKARDVEIHARSIFLQGLFFMGIDELPDHFHSVKNILAELHQVSEMTMIPLHALLLNHAVMQKEIDKVVIGVTGLAELQQNICAYHYVNQLSRMYSNLDRFAVTDEKIILPFNWR